MSTLLHDAMILTLDANNMIIEQGYVLVRSDRIAEVGHGRYIGPVVAERSIDCRDRLVANSVVSSGATGWQSKRPDGRGPVDVG